MTLHLFADTPKPSGISHSSATFSPCRRYRYALSRQWDVEVVTRCAFVMLNPSSATDIADDPTIRRCIAFAKRWGHAALDVVNLFAFRSTDPRALATVDDPTGPDNDAHIVRIAEAATVVICAWGAHGTLGGRNEAVLKLLAPFAPKVLSLTKDGHPGHPLYLRKDLLPVAFDEARAPKGTP